MLSIIKKIHINRIQFDSTTTLKISIAGQFFKCVFLRLHNRIIINSTKSISFYDNKTNLCKFIQFS